MEHALLRAIPAPITALLDEGCQLWRRGALGEAQGRLELALARAAMAGSLAGLLSARQLLGNLAYERGDLTAAHEHHLFVLSESEDLGLGVGVASSLHNLGLIAAREGDAGTARAQLLAAAYRYERLGMIDAMMMARENLAKIESGPWPQQRPDDEQR